MIEEIIFKVVIGKTADGKTKQIPVKGKKLHENGRIYVWFPFNKTLISEIKSFEGHQWHGPIPSAKDWKPKPLPPEFRKAINTTKCWSISDSHRNRFQLFFLTGGNPYARYNAAVPKNEYTRPLYEHQKDMSDHGLARHYCELAGEMGTGKTLSAIEIMERSGYTDWWYVAPKSVLKAIERELRIWDSKIKPELMTYNHLVKVMSNWPEGNKAPHGVVFDESQRIKTPTSQRSQAAMQLAEGIRSDWGDEGFVLPMSGAPAPKDPTDHWHQCEVACPGFLREGTLSKFKTRLGLFKEKKSFSGGVFLEKITWLDDENKCAVCGQFEEHQNHVPGAAIDWHPFQKSVNEVAKLYERMRGLVIVKFKKDCLDLPDKIYRTIECTPTPSIRRAAALIAKTSKTTIQALTLLRELSDGFQYVEKVVGEEECCLCHGIPYFEPAFDSEINQPQKMVEAECPHCKGTGLQKKLERDAKQVDCPKVEVYKDLLDEHHDYGRLVAYAGFTGSVDRLVQEALAEKWNVIRADGRGWEFYGEDGHGDADHLSIFQDKLELYPRVVFVGQPGAAGEGLTLHASPTCFYYSNTFNGNDRIQSEDRIHRIGMDVNRGATIIDVFHLDADRLVYENIRKKRQLQALSLGELQAAMEVSNEAIRQH